MTASTYDFSDLSAIYINCTLKRSPEISNTAGLMAVSIAIMRKHGVQVDEVRAVDHELAPGVQPDMTVHGFDRDDWPPIYARVERADILVIGTPIWLGDKSSMCTRVIERLYANSGELNDAGQYAYYGKVGGVIVTGNEDGIKHVAMNVLYSLQHLGCVIPPQADAGWIGEAGPGPSYLDEGSGGPENEFHPAQHRVHDVEPDASGRHDQARRRHPRARQLAFRLGRRRPLRPPEPRQPFGLTGHTPSSCGGLSTPPRAPKRCLPAT
ncbi:MAG TPA: NAD(P)H-dependent oxidoreductase [Jiangellaceae bacterium]|nr:NAD(P)H-dependent oxidoreductase [Jiangellaceae bacterium]